MDIKEIKKLIPYGGIKVIAKKSNVHYITAVAFFNGKRKVSKPTETAILNNTAKYLNKLHAQKEKATLKLKNAVKNG